MPLGPMPIEEKPLDRLYRHGACARADGVRGDVVRVDADRTDGVRGEAVRVLLAYTERR